MVFFVNLQGPWNLCICIILWPNQICVITEVVSVGVVSCSQKVWMARGRGEGHTARGQGHSQGGHTLNQSHLLRGRHAELNSNWFFITYILQGYSNQMICWQSFFDSCEFWFQVQIWCPPAQIQTEQNGEKCWGTTLYNPVSFSLPHLLKQYVTSTIWKRLHLSLRIWTV